MVRIFGSHPKCPGSSPGNGIFILLNEINTVYVYPFSNGRSFLKLQQMLNVYTKKVTRETKLSEEKVYIKTKREEHIVTNFNLDCFY